MIRLARIGDLPGCLQLGRRLHEQTPWHEIPIDTATVGRTFGECINNAFGFAMVAVHDREVTGLLLGVAEPLWFAPKRSAKDIVLVSEYPGDGRRLARRFIEWAWSIPSVVDVTLSQSSGIAVPRMDVFYRRLGLRCVGSLYIAVR